VGDHRKQHQAHNHKMHVKSHQEDEGEKAFSLDNTLRRANLDKHLQENKKKKTEIPMPFAVKLCICQPVGARKTKKKFPYLQG
jgi:hypothetical protein